MTILAYSLLFEALTISGAFELAVETTVFCYNSASDALLRKNVHLTDRPVGAAGVVVSADMGPHPIRVLPTA